ncbi:hypothetical protein B0H66DRAFT_77005 [Apodospora peruviana]|uniref:Uncharacterized protein n=1 Tax=Apodospora peruviana TaxID=516989 RepID=A0AAE0IT91_9PEZI|nr:hypothetical protein B0H66DRAFT_77005 [Apodospora peruviana]
MVCRFIAEGVKKARLSVQHHAAYLLVSYVPLIRNTSLYLWLYLCLSADCYLCIVYLYLPETLGILVLCHDLLAELPRSCKYQVPLVEVDESTEIGIAILCGYHDQIDKVLLKQKNLFLLLISVCCRLVSFGTYFNRKGVFGRVSIPNVCVGWL